MYLKSHTILFLLLSAETPPSATSNVVLFPPSAIPPLLSPNNPVPLIIPHMAPSQVAHAPGSMVLQATQGLPTTIVNKSPVHPCDRDLELPHFNDDEQLYHFVITRLRKTLTDCTKQFSVSVAYHFSLDMNENIHFVMMRYEFCKPFFSLF